jgi:hypothetical protein
MGLLKHQVIEWIHMGITGKSMTKYPTTLKEEEGAIAKLYLRCCSFQLFAEIYLTMNNKNQNSFLLY